MTLARGAQKGMLLVGALDLPTAANWPQPLSILEISTSKSMEMSFAYRSDRRLALKADAVIDRHN
jgi:hypothetical protein